MTRSLTRRQLLGFGAATTAGVAAGGLTWLAARDGDIELDASSAAASLTPTATPAPAAPGETARATDPVLVVLQCGGGNDALNSLVPTAGRYRDLRPTVAVAETHLVSLTGVEDVGLHPALAPLTGLWEKSWLAPIASVGFDDQSRSHFVALETWWTAEPGGSSSRTGWLGRWLDATGEGPDGPLRALALGSGSPALLSLSNPATVVSEPAAFAFDGPRGVDEEALLASYAALATPVSGHGVLAAAQASIPATIDAVDLLADARSLVVDDRSVGPVTALLGAAADVITMDIGTQVVVVGAGGFDTHANQVAQHERLLADVASGLAEFYDALEASRDADRVVTVVISEFGRRVAENGSAGADHGRGGLALMCGPAVAGGRIVGGYDLATLVDGDLAVQVDARSVYAAALDWLGGPTDEILAGDWDRHGLLA